MDDKIVLICATGRSGSTTMMRILNTIPHSNICGENAGAINSLLDFYRRIRFSSETHIPGNFNPASYEYVIQQNFKPSWYNSYNYQQMVHLIKMTIINMFKNKETTNVWGFKEIRYDHGNINYLKDFKELFPQTKVIIQIRENIQAQSKSAWFKKNSNASTFLAKTNNEFVEFYRQNKEWCYLTSFERMFDMENIKNMFGFIQCEEDFEESKVREILANNLKD